MVVNVVFHCNICFSHLFSLFNFTSTMQYPAGTPEVALTTSDSSGITVLASPIGGQAGYKRSAFIGSCKHQVWQAIRASSAAPYYLDDFSVGIDFLCYCLHQVAVFIFWLFPFLFCIALTCFSFYPAMCQRCQPLARWCDSGKQSYNFCHKRSTTSVA